MYFGYLPYGAADTFLKKLQMAGCHKIVKESNPEGQSDLLEMAGSLKEGDVLILCRSGHAGSEAGFLDLLILIGQAQAHFVSLEENLDTLRDTALHLTEVSR